MSRYHSQRDLSPIFEAAEHWRDRCLIEDGAVFADTPLWTPAHLYEALAVIDRAVPSGEGSWVDQFATIFANHGELVQLMAEALWVFYLFPLGSGANKRENLAKLWPAPSSSPYLRDAVLAGIAQPGQAYFRHAWRELRYLLDFARFVKTYDADKRGRLFRGAEDLARHLEKLAVGQTRGGRHTLLYLFFPDETEPLISFRAKRSRLERHGHAAPKGDNYAVDRALLDLRAELGSRDYDLFLKPAKTDAVKVWRIALPQRSELADELHLPFATPPNPGDIVYLTLADSDETLARGVVADLEDADDTPAHWPVQVQERGRRPGKGTPLAQTSPASPAAPVDDATGRNLAQNLDLLRQRPDDLWPDQIETPGNFVYCGPPGTGKTHRLLQTLADYEEANQAPRWSLVTFHASYGYEEFVEGFRPNAEGRLELRAGAFKALCERAKHNQGRRYGLFIDELNRGNLTAIFGELITLLEPDKRCVWAPDGSLRAGRQVRLAYSQEPFGVPKNLDLFAAMNTADRSLVHFDLALRRRFHFIACPPQPNLLPALQLADGSQLDLAALLRRLNQRIACLLDDDHVLGHSYFLHLSSWEMLAQRLTEQVFPLLEELFYDDPDGLRLVLGPELVQLAAVDEKGLFGQTLDRTVRRRARLLEPALLTPDHLRSLIAP